jgi:hypothetical protein
MSDAPSLRRTQEIFWRLITAPEGVHSGIDTLTGRRELDAGDVDALFHGAADPAAAQLSAAERLDIYANMYFYRLLDALKEDFPRVLAAIGADRFHNLVTDYLLQHPPRHPSLRYLGERFPAAVAGHRLNVDHPYLADLARLEWDRVEMFDAPDASPMTRERLAGLSQERAGEARFTLVPACRVRRFDYDVARIWRELKDESADAGTSGERGRTRVTRLRIWRQEFVVYHRAIDEDEAGSLELIAAGQPFERICQQLSAGRSPESATQRIGSMMQSWIDDGILAGFNLPAG